MKEIQKICSQFELSPLVGTILYNRGFNNEDLVAEYLGFKTKKFNPLEVIGVTDAVARILWALDNGERILVYGDYDVDGMTSSAILYSYLAQYSEDRERINYYVPDRILDGYGLTEKGIRRLAETGFEGLVVTVDNGISAYHEVELAKNLGKFEIVITDHHDLPTDKPVPQTWLINPKQGNQFPEMSGAGVAHMLCCALEKTRPTPRGVNWLMDLVAVGTVADMCPLIGINRSLVKYGLKVLNNKLRVGLYSLLNVSGHNFKDQINSETIGFKIGPCLNAAGRIDNPTQCVELLITDNMKYADDIAFNLYELNEKRKELSRDTAKKADEIARKMLENKPDTGVFIIQSKDFHPGIVGLVANKMVEKYNAPVLMMHEDENGNLKGSARTTLDFDIREGLANSSELLGKWGGHSGAAGLSVTKENVRALEESLSAQFLVNRKRDEILRHRFDAEVSLKMMTYTLLEELQLFEPTGMSNPPVYFRTSGLEVTYSKMVGKTEPKEHMQLRVKKDGFEMKGIYFFAPHMYPLPTDRPIVVCYKPCINEFPPGRKNIEMMVKEVFWEKD